MFKTPRIKKYFSNQPAFSLIEIMAVILIVSLGLVGTVNLAIQNIQAQVINKDNLIAYQLAQEGLELVRQNRDTNWINGDDWLLSLSTGKYCVDYRNLAPYSVNAINDCPLYFTADHKYYSPDINGEVPITEFSNFYRIVEINASTSSASVMSIVSWTSRNGGVQNYNLETMLYDWR